MDDKIPPLLSWRYYNDPVEELPSPKRATIPPDTPPSEAHLYDYDKLIAENTGLYREWWILWKRIHPEWALIPEKEPEIKVPPKPKVTFKKLSCKRCGRTWTPRSKNPPVQCPKCKSPYWNRDKKKV